MDAGGARHLRQTLHGRLDLLARDQHQIGELVDDDDDVGHRLEPELLLLVNGLARGAVETGLHRARNRLAAFLGVAHARMKTSMLRTAS